MPQKCFDVRTVNKANRVKRTRKHYLNAITANVIFKELMFASVLFISFGDNLFSTV